MATGGPSATKGKEEDVRHTCSLCMESYRGRHPKLLPCYHTFCLPCLTALEASVRSAKRDTATDDDLGQKETQTDQAASPKGEEGEGEAQTCEGPEGTSPLKDDPMGSDDVSASHGDVDRGSFLCPTCRAPVPIPVGGVAALQTSFYVDHEPDPEEDLPSVLCDMCEEDNRQQATHTCQECQLSMCRTCRRHHDMLIRDHHVTPVNLGLPTKQKQEKKGLCLIHQMTSHDRHETADLVSAALQAREEITSLIPTAQHQLQVMEMSIQQVDREDRQLTRHVQQVTQQIHSRYDVLMTWARQSRDQLVEEMSAKEASTRSQLQAEKASSTLTRDILSTLLSRAARATAADPDVVMWRKELKAALLPDDKLDHHKQRADSQGCSWAWDYDVTDASVLHEDDVRAYMGRVVEGADAEVNRVPGSPRELVDTVERWMKEVTENTHTLTSQLTSCTNDLTALQKKGDELEKELGRKTGELQKKGDELERKTGELQKKEDELERKTGELQKKGDELEKELERKTGELQKKGDELEKELERKTGELQKKEDELEKELERKTGELQKKGDEQKKETDELWKLTQSLKKNLGKASELFWAGRLNTDATKTNQAMLFRTVHINEGGHYQPDTGVFTTPQAGLYCFSASIVRDPGWAANGHIMVDDVKYCIVKNSEHGGSESVTVPLTAGRKVWVKAVSYMHQYDGNTELNWFKGTLVLPFP